MQDALSDRSDADHPVRVLSKKIKEVEIVSQSFDDIG